MSEQKLPQFPPDISGRGEEKVVTWGKNPVTIVCSQVTAINFSISANQCSYGSKNQSLDYLHYLEWGNDEPLQQFLSDKQ